MPRLEGKLSTATDDIDPVYIYVRRTRDGYVYKGSQEYKDPSGFSRYFGLVLDEEFEMVLPRQEISERSPLGQPKLYTEPSFIGYS
jgi:phosphatidylinositol glycan class T